MRRLRNDLPYRFRPPLRRGWLRPLGLMVNRVVHLQRKYRISAVADEGFEEVRRLCADGHSVMIAPNHSDHSDPHVIMEIARRHRIHPYFMGAREIFEVSPLAGWALQSMGVFSARTSPPSRPPSRC
jgi:1-acyl-sn-glycerol-3-phosphate acyltransferase